MVGEGFFFRPGSDQFPEFHTIITMESLILRKYLTHSFSIGSRPLEPILAYIITPSEIARSVHWSDDTQILSCSKEQILIVIP